ncbi:PilN domain-containing protein [Halomonas sp. 18H]|uniref:PilN domain-containing protein n=1 Tax=Halomonas almeriensis TaxID=308163 RepID=UPI00223095BE|nr:MULTISPECIES: PilN domain-containing protein [Halomonas]MCW4149696.1 PilN domain-containing protein [Halomonas sp. 18H]MDN3553359.1 PilN domain-containing protein [Halomonas almeriensis]
MTIEINLLPWRDARRQARRRRWQRMLLGALLSGLLLGVAADRHQAARLESQRARLALIEQHTQALQPALAELADVQARAGRLEARLAVLHRHLGQQGRMLEWFNGLAETLVTGVGYISLTQRQQRLTLEGQALSHQRIAAQLKALEASPVWRAPSLSMVEPGAAGWDFRLRVLLEESSP